MILIYQMQILLSKSRETSRVIAINVYSEAGMVSMNKLLCDLVRISGPLVEEVTIQFCSKRQKGFVGKS